MIEVLKQALEALEKNYKLINGEGTRFGLEGAMDGYYSGCFDVDGTNKETENAIASLRQAIAELESQERNFCPRCGKRTNDIHTCTPPQGIYYTPPQRTWVGLTDYEIDKTHETQVWDARRSYARAIEAKLKEKNT
jgi:hypothetical protein